MVSPLQWQIYWTHLSLPLYFESLETYNNTCIRSYVFLHNKRAQGTKKKSSSSWCKLVFRQVPKSTLRWVERVEWKTNLSLQFQVKHGELPLRLLKISSSLLLPYPPFLVLKSYTEINSLLWLWKHTFHYKTVEQGFRGKASHSGACFNSSTQWAETGEFEAGLFYREISRTTRTIMQRKFILKKKKTNKQQQQKEFSGGKLNAIYSRDSLICVSYNDIGCW